MKFGKSLRNQIEETLPEWRDQFLSYKDLKKRLKLIDLKDGNNGDFHPAKRRRLSSGDCGDGSAVSVAEDGMSSEEVDFIRLLEDELEKFNSFFVEKEEEYIIRMKELQDRVAKAKALNEEMWRIKKEIVDLHGEMVLLENYSALNYTGLVKILKKYDKRTGALIRLPFIQKVLQQPFFTTNILYKLVKECERIMLDLLSPKTQPSVASTGDADELCGPTTSATTAATAAQAAATAVDGLLKSSKELGDIERVECMYMRSTISALMALKEIRSGSSTVSMFSLPPLQFTGVETVEAAWKKIPVLEQVAK